MAAVAAAEKNITRTQRDRQMRKRKEQKQRKKRWKRTGHRQHGGPEDANPKDYRENRGREQRPGCCSEHPGAARYHPTKPLPSRAVVNVW